MTDEFATLHRAMFLYVRERDSGPAGHIFIHHVVPAFLAWLASDARWSGPVGEWTP